MRRPPTGWIGVAAIGAVLLLGCVITLVIIHPTGNHTSAAGHPDPTLVSARADTLIRLHRPAEAERILKQALANPASFPNRDALADAALHLAFAASQADDPRVCLQALALLATVQPPSPAALFLEATSNDALHQSNNAAELYRRFLSAASGGFPDQEAQARKRISELAHVK